MRLLFLMIAFSIAGLGQTVESRSVMLKGTSLPGTCTVGERFFKTDATAGQNLYLCTSANTWTQVSGGSGASYPTDLLCNLTVSAATATFASGASGTNRCNFQNGPFTAPATLIISGSPPVGTYWWETDGTTIFVKLPGADAGLTAGGVTKVASASGFTAGRVPIGKTSYTSGANWDATVEDNRPHFSLSLNPVAGTGLSSSDSGGNRTLNVDSSTTMLLGTAQTSTAKKTFSPTASAGGLQLTCAALPSSPANGDIACDSGDSNKVKVRSNGAWVEAGGGTGDMVLASAQTSTAKKTFSPTATDAGLALTCTTLPSSPANGDEACDPDGHIRLYSNGEWRYAAPTFSSTYGMTDFGFQPNSGTATAITGGTQYARHWDNPGVTTIKYIGISIGTAQSSSESTRVGIFTPGCGTALGISDAFNGTGTGDQFLTFSTAVVVPPGTYCIITASNSTTLTLRINQDTAPQYNGGTMNQGTTRIGTCANGMSGSGATATLQSCGAITPNLRLYAIRGYAN